MKSKIILLLLVLFSVLSCYKEEEGQGYFDFGQEKGFYLNREYISNNEHLKFSILAITDSRCPEGVVCVWQGEARVTVLVEAFPDQVLDLSTYNNQKDTLNNYVFELIDVSPYPNIENEIELDDYVVTLRITQEN